MSIVNPDGEGWTQLGHIGKPPSAQLPILAELPGLIDEYRLRYLEMRSSSDPEDFNAFKARYIANPLNTSPLNVIGQLLNSERVLTAIGSMKYGVIRLRELAPLTFLTSDRPFIMSDGIGRPDGHITIPILPRCYL